MLEFQDVVSGEQPAAVVNPALLQQIGSSLTYFAAPEVRVVTALGVRGGGGRRGRTSPWFTRQHPATREYTTVSSKLCSSMRN